MYIHPGRDKAINHKDIIAIFDMDNTTIARATRGFLSRAQSDGNVVDINEDDLPRSFIVTGQRGKETVYLSSMLSTTMVKNNKQKK